MLELRVVVVFLLCVNEHVTPHSDHLPAGLLPGSTGPWDAPGFLDNFEPQEDEPDIIGVHGQSEQTVELRMPPIRPTEVS